MSYPAGWDADLIVVRNSEKNLLPPRLVRVFVGSITRRMLEELPCSLLSVQQEEVLDEVYGKVLQERNALISDARDLCAAGLYDRELPKLRRVLELTPLDLRTVEVLAETHKRLENTVDAEKVQLHAEQLRSFGEC